LLAGAIAKAESTVVHFANEPENFSVDEEAMSLPEGFRTIRSCL
jgi:hypothetical protein